MPNIQHSGFGKYPLKIAALGLLMSGPKHGYQLHQEFTEAFDQIWKAGQSKFYVALNALEDDGHIHATTESQEGRPARKVYHLTGTGQELFLEWLHQPVESMRAIRVEFIAKLRFFDLLDLPGVEQQIDSQIVVLQAMLNEWEQTAVMDEDGPFPGLIHDFRKQQAEFIIRWLETAKECFRR